MKNVCLQKEPNDRELRELDMEYRRTNNRVRRETRKEIKNKERLIANNVKDNPKIFWNYVQKKLTRKVGIPIFQVTNGDHTTLAESDTEKAEMLAGYFTEAFTEEPVGDAPSIPVKLVPSELDFSVTKIIKTLKKLKRNKSPGPDGLHPRIIKEGAEQLALPHKIFDYSFKHAAVPKEWRIANITDFRKAFDKVPHKRLMEKVKSYGISAGAHGNHSDSFLDIQHERLTLHKTRIKKVGKGELHRSPR